MTPDHDFDSVGRRRILRTLGRVGAGVSIVNTDVTDRVNDGEAASDLFHALGVVSVDERAADGDVADRETTGRGDLGLQQQSGWNRFFDHGLEDLIPDTEANGGGCLIVLGDNKSVKRFDAEGKKGWEKSYETYLDDLIPVSEANGGGYLIALENPTTQAPQLVRLGPNGSPQWRRTYGSEDVGRGIYSVTEAGADGFVFVGFTHIDDSWSVSWVAKISGDGAVTWELEKSLLGDRQTYGQSANRVYRMNDGYLIEGGRYHTIWLAKINEARAIEWNHEFSNIGGGPVETFITEEGSIYVSDPAEYRLIGITADGTIQLTRGYGHANLPDQVLDAENGALVARMTGDRQNILEMLRDDGSRRWWREYDQAYTVAHGETDGYVLFGTDSVRKINAQGTNEWVRPLYVPTDIEYLFGLDGGGYLLGGIKDLSGEKRRSWIALRESLAGGVAVLPDVNGDGNPSQDPNGDGLYEDVNGDGSRNVGDAQALYNNRNSARIQINGELYDFNNDGEVNVGDAQRLYFRVTDN